MSNQKQLFLATTLYADDVDDCLPYPGGDTHLKTQALHTTDPIGIGVLYAGRYLTDAQMAFCPDNSYTGELVQSSSSRLDYLAKNGRHNGGNSWTYITYVSRSVSSTDSIDYYAPYTPNAARLSTNANNATFVRTTHVATMKSPRALYICAIPLLHPLWRSNGGLASHSRRWINATYADGTVFSIPTNPAKPFMLGLGNDLNPQFLGVDMQHPDYQPFYPKNGVDLYKSNAKLPN